MIDLRTELQLRHNLAREMAQARFVPSWWEPIEMQRWMTLNLTVARLLPDMFRFKYIVAHANPFPLQSDLSLDAIEYYYNKYGKEEAEREIVWWLSQEIANSLMGWQRAYKLRVTPYVPAIPSKTIDPMTFQPKISFHARFAFTSMA